MTPHSNERLFHALNWKRRDIQARSPSSSSWLVDRRLRSLTPNEEKMTCRDKAIPSRCCRDLDEHWLQSGRRIIPENSLLRSKTEQRESSLIPNVGQYLEMKI